MKAILIGLLIGVLALPGLAQVVGPIVPSQPVADDSASRNITPGIRLMGTGFYRRPGDPRDVVRATLDNMPIKGPDPDQEYSMLNAQRRSQFRYRLPVPDSLRWRYRPRR